jgi:hypothetical protein
MQANVLTFEKVRENLMTNIILKKSRLRHCHGLWILVIL